MGPLTGLWSLLTQSPGDTLHPGDWVALGVAAALGILGLVGAYLGEKSLASRMARTHDSATPGLDADYLGRVEYQLRAELWIKVGVGLVIWDVAFMLSFFLRYVATPGLESWTLPVLSMGALIGVTVYALIYRFALFPRYARQCRQIDARLAYQPAKKGRKGDATADQGALKPPAIEVMPTSALVGLLAAPVAYYFVMFVPTGELYHDLHQIGMLVAAPLGYVIGLAVSLGAGYRSGSFWVKGAATRA
ncbi:MAG TPA: hypothetical protein VE338_02220 [Ktedonobacterales bacterium]|nr:hypothetical protein [Ktedonobacterales bacterium]